MRLIKQQLFLILSLLCVADFANAHGLHSETNSPLTHFFIHNWPVVVGLLLVVIWHKYRQRK